MASSTNDIKSYDYDLVVIGGGSGGIYIYLDNLYLFF